MDLLGSALAAVRRDEHMATFADILSLLVRQQVPLGQALLLAAEASGDVGLRQVSQNVADRLESGETLTGREAMPIDFPPRVGMADRLWGSVVGTERGTVTRPQPIAAPCERDYGRPSTSRSR